MALFPSNPTNGETTIVNGITYTYNSAQTAWIRTAAAPSGDFNVSGNLTATGNISGVRLISNVATGTAPLTVTSTTRVSNLNVANAGFADSAGTATSATTAGTVTTAAQPNITSVGTLSSLGVTGNITSGNANLGNAVNANFFIGSGNNLSNIQGANVTGAVASATSATTAGTVTTAAQPNITSVGTLTSVAITGNATAGNVYANSGTIGASLLTGTLTTAAQPNITSVGTLTSAAVTGNVTAGNVYANSGTIGASIGVLTTGNITTINSGLMQNGNSNVTITANANVTLHAVGGARIVATSTGANVLGTLGVSGNANVGNLGTAQVLASANVTAPQLISNVATGTAPLVVTSTTQVANLNAATAGTATSATSATNAAALLQNTSTATTVYPFFTTSGANGNSSAVINTSISANLGNASITATTFVGALSGAATTAGTVTTAAQPNITSVGTLTSLGVSGTVTAPAFTANTGVFTGNGSGLSAIAGANVTGTVSAATTAGTVTTAAQPNITSVGTLTSLSVTGNISGANLTGNHFGNGSALSAITGANVTGTVPSATSATTAGTVTTAAQPNITSVGTLTSASVTGNVTAGNVYANSGTIGASLLTGTLTTAAQPNITSVGTLTSATVTGNVAAGNLTTTGVLSVTGTGVSSIAGNLDMTSNAIINLATPTNPTDAATKQYVDDVAQGLNIHDSVAAATPTTLATITGGTITYNNGSSGVGANLTTTGSFNLIDGVNVQTAGTRILVRSEANAVHNGIYTWSNATVITRATDYDSVPEVEAGDFVFVTGGTLYDNTGWVQTDSITAIGAAGNNINFTQFSGAGTYQAGTGLTLTGPTFSVNASQTQITSVGTLTGLNSSGTITAPAFTANTGVFTGNGSGLSAIAGANVTGTVSSATSATTAGTVTTAAQPNITSVGTLTSLAVTGNASAGNLNTAGAVVASTLTSNVATGTAPLTVTSTTRVANLNVAQANVADFIGVAAGTGNNFLIFANAATGNVAELTSTGLTANLSNNSITATTFVGSLSGAATSATTAGTVTTAAQPNITSVGTLTSLGVNGTVTAVAFTANTGVFTGNGSGLSAIAGANVTGTVSSATSATTAGTVTTAAQPNITSVGTLTGLTVNGTATITTGNVTTINSGLMQNGNSNVTITANGNVTLHAVGGARITATSTGANVTGTLGVSGNANVLNLGTAQVLATANVTAPQLISNVATGTAPLVVTSTTQVANLNAATAGTATSATTAGTVTTAAQPNITSTGTLTSLTVSGDTFLATSSGNVGVGTASPAFTSGSGLEVQRAGIATIRVENSNFNASEIRQTGAAFELVSLGSQPLVLGTNNTERMRVTAGGVVQINTTSGAGHLNVNGSTGGPAILLSDSLSSNPFMQFQNGSFIQGIGSGGLEDLRFRAGGTTGDLLFDTNSAERMRITETGNVGIGNTAPAHRLSVTGTTLLNGNVTVQSNLAYVAPNGANTITSRMANGGTLSWNGNAGQLFSIVDSMTGNIFTVNDVSGIPLISVDAGGNIQFAVSGGFVNYGVTTGITAAGSTQGTATALTRPINVVSTVSASTGVILPTVPAGARIIVMNTSGTALNVYPPSGAIINSAATNAAYSMPAGTRLEFISVSSTQWYTMNATYG